MKEFDRLISQEHLNITDKTRSNLFAWRGQFSPQLIEILLKSYCLPNAVILDPFVGSGTVLLEAGKLGFEAYGFEINPSAYILSRIYEFINDIQRKDSIQKVRKQIESRFPFQLSGEDPEITNLAEIVIEIEKKSNKESNKIFEALVILLDIDKNKITNGRLWARLDSLIEIINKLPFSERNIEVGLSDARELPLKDNQIDFVLTSPPYINVFNYHQNYRKSAELLGWNLLKIAKSEIGSNRANRGNRFYTVVQYCLDMADAIKEIARVSKINARIILVVGHQSNVLGVPFYNADIIEKIGVKSGYFIKVSRQKRQFKNKFGKIIREDIINFLNAKEGCSVQILESIAREVALNVLQSNLSFVASKNYDSLEIAISKVRDIKRTTKLNPNKSSYCLSQSANMTNRTTVAST